MYFNIILNHITNTAFLIISYNVPELRFIYYNTKSYTYLKENSCFKKSHNLREFKTDGPLPVTGGIGGP